jgi:hypothetical protein
MEDGAAVWRWLGGEQGLPGRGIIHGVDRNLFLRRASDRVFSVYRTSVRGAVGPVPGLT